MITLTRVNICTARTRGSQSLARFVRSIEKRFVQIQTPPPQDTKVKINAANVQLLSPSLHAQIFGKYADPREDKAEHINERVEYAKEHLTLQNIWGKKADTQPPIDLKLPSMYGRDIEEHFMRIGLEQSEGYLQKSEQFANQQLPAMPTQWSRNSGWTRYASDGTVTSVPYPLEETFAFDVEVLVKEGHYPTMAVAASSEAWYSWTSPYLFGESKHKEHLIPLGHERQRLVIGHNVGYDRSRVAEEYSRVPSGIRYIDTMSLHIAVAGLCSQQRPAWLSEVKRRNHDRVDAMPSNTESPSSTGEELQRMDIGQAKFFDVSTLNSLKDVGKFYCNVNVDKNERSYFVTGSLQDIQENFDSLMRYCAKDVDLTHQIYRVVFPRYRQNCPHPVSFAGMLHMGNSFLTVTEKWDKYLAQSVQKHQELHDMLDVKLRDLAAKACELVNEPEVWQSDPWLSQLDWFVNPRQRKLKGAPKWYKDAYDSKTGKLKISTRSRVAPLLLRLKWQNFPLHYLPSFGWCYKLPPGQVTQNMVDKIVYQDENYVYCKVPHKDGESANCGNPLAKNYISYFEEKVLTSEFAAAREALELNAKSAYWISSRERILNQFVVWDTNPNVSMALPKQSKDKNLEAKYGIILPQMVVMGTVTRRAVEKTWLTASNAKANRIGSELKSMVQAPEGYKIVGADVDSEELWISSVISDAQFGFHGATALGWMTLQGSKSEGTDLHSKTAQILGINRDKAKIFNYARIYGAGVKYAASLLMQYNQGMDLEAAKQRAMDLYSSTKGEKEHSVRNRFKRTYWHGGSESYMFNALEDIALSKEPRTPVLGCAVTDALKPRYTGSQFLTSRINWVVQSSGVDYLHLLIASMAHLIDRYQIDARFMLSVHDEVRYLSSEKDQYRTALALQVANLWTRAMFSHKIGIKDLPQSVAFFSSVDIDHVLRKEPNMTCVTPSHEDKIEEGISCDLNDALDKLESLTNLHREKDCLLGEERPTAGLVYEDDTIKEMVQHQHQVQGKRKPCSLAFLEAQMHKSSEKSPDYRQHGGGETKEKVQADEAIPILPPAPIRHDTRPARLTRKMKFYI
ncbi:DNA polymerase family A-domain-containing protein [Radiomyces spectabilis]|uniref:DNA polymerase family A-domain-containing protein n=1 Tax=Radiomyces spectabilis TaxID=64574 RepID=UPI00221F96C0|nr:DNA polymerase family A-domain-containing protein [Radiomyces spectabilis]KAI8393307.1 DNA polymerase family A-domain-containing protein [Radiomyces spectabilis]